MRENLELRFEESEDFDFLGHVVVYNGSLKVGVAKLSREGEVAKLADIIVYSYKKQIISFLPIYKEVSFRKKGIGTELLKKVISFCKINGIKIIKGKVVGDLNVLVPWYTKNGFMVNEENELYINLSA